MDERMDYEYGGEGDGPIFNVMGLELGRPPEPASADGEVRRNVACLASFAKRFFKLIWDIAGLHGAYSQFSIG